MLEIFKTVNGTWNLVLIFSCIAWLVSTAGIISRIAQAKGDLTLAQQTAAQEKKQKEEAEKRLSEAEKKIKELTPQPLKERIVSLLDPDALNELREGKPVNVSVMLNQHSINIIRGLATEDAEGRYIKEITPPLGPTPYIVTEEGELLRFAYRVFPALVSED